MADLRALGVRFAGSDSTGRQRLLLGLLGEVPGEDLDRFLAQIASSEPDEGARTTALYVRSMVGPPAGAPPDGEAPAGASKLVETFDRLLSDRSSRIRMGALSKVLKYRDASLIPLVAEAMTRETQPAVLTAMLSLLGQLGGPEQVPRILPVLDHSEPRVVVAAMGALSRLLHEVATGLLRPLADHEDDRVSAAALTLLAPLEEGLVDGRLTESLRSPEPATRLFALDVIERLDDPRHRTLVTGLLETEIDPMVREVARGYLRGFDPTSDQGTLAALVDRLGHRDGPVRRDALDEAGRYLGDPGVLGLVQAIAQFDRDEEIRLKAVDLLGGRPDVSASGTAGSIGDLSGLMKEEDQGTVPPAQKEEQILGKLKDLLSRRQPRMRMKAVLKVHKYRYEKLLPNIVEQLELESSPIVIAAMIATVGEMGSEEHVSLLAPYLSHANHRVVSAAIVALHRLGGDSLLELFLPILAREDRRIVNQALIALERLDPERLHAYVGSMTRSPHERLRRAALNCLDRLAPETSEDLLVDWVRREPSPEILRGAYDLLAGTATARSVGALYALKSRSPNREVYVRKVFEGIASRHDTPVDELERQGREFFETHPEMFGEGVDDEAKSYQQALFQQMEEKEKSREDARKLTRYRQPMPVLATGIAGLVVLWLALDGGRRLTDLGVMDLPRDIDPMRLAQGMLEARVPTGPGYVPVEFRPLESMPGGSPAEKLQAYAEQFVSRPPRLTPEQLVEAQRAFLKQQGFKNYDYIEMQALGRTRERLDQVMALADEKAAGGGGGGDLAAAIALLEAHLETLDPRNLLHRREILLALASLALELRDVDRARRFTIAADDVSRKVLEIEVQTEQPWGGTVANAEQLARAREGRASLEEAFAQAGDRIRSTGSLGVLTPDETANLSTQMRANLEAALAEGKIDRREYEEELRDLEDAVAGSPPGAPLEVAP